MNNCIIILNEKYQNFDKNSDKYYSKNNIHLDLDFEGKKYNFVVLFRLTY